MSYDALEVTTAHLRELAARHGQAAAEMTTAAGAVAGVDTRIRASHGVIAWSTAAAVEAIQHHRAEARWGLPFPAAAPGATRSGGGAAQRRWDGRSACWPLP